MESGKQDQLAALSSDQAGTKDMELREILQLAYHLCSPGSATHQVVPEIAARKSLPFDSASPVDGSNIWAHLDTMKCAGHLPRPLRPGPPWIWDQLLPATFDFWNIYH